MTIRTIDLRNRFSTSSEKMKNQVQEMSRQLDRIAQIEPASFRWNESGEQDVGVIAEQVQKVFPELVGNAPTGELGVNYEAIAALALQGVKELKERVEQLEDSK